MSAQLKPADIILRQLGTSAVWMMGGTAALRSAASEDGGRTLYLRIGRNRLNANVLRITLDPDDTYTVRLCAKRGARVTEKHRSEGIYADQLHSVISEATGLALAIPRIKGWNA